ncbi:22485_t:CDS:2, partial [Dentiscutata erythropus]
AENDKSLSVILNNALDKREKIPFMAVDFEDRKKALQAIQDKNFETASDDMFSFH